MDNNAGKGDDWRTDFDYTKFWTNFDSISGSPMTTAVKVEKKRGKTTYTYKA